MILHPLWQGASRKVAEVWGFWPCGSGAPPGNFNGSKTRSEGTVAFFTPHVTYIHFPPRSDPMREIRSKPLFGSYAMLRLCCSKPEHATVTPTSTQHACQSHLQMHPPLTTIRLTARANLAKIHRNTTKYPGKTHCNLNLGHFLETPRSIRGKLHSTQILSEGNWTWRNCALQRRGRRDVARLPLSQWIYG